MTERNWALFRNMYFTDQHWFAALLVSKTKKMVTFTKRPDSELDEPVSRKNDWLIRENLTKEEAEALAKEGRDSLTISDQEIKDSAARHKARLKAILDKPAE